MPWEAISAAITGGTSLVSGLLGSSAAKSAAALQAGAANRAISTEQGANYQNRLDLSPYRSVGTGALSRLEALLGLSTGTPGAATGNEADQAGLAWSQFSATGDDRQKAAQAENYMSDRLWGAGGVWDRYTKGQISFDQANAEKAALGSSFESWMRNNVADNNVIANTLAHAGKSTGYADFAKWGGPDESGYYGGRPAGTGAKPAASASTDSNFGKLNEEFPAFNFGATDFQTDPGYQFRLSEGQKAVERSAAAKTGTLSGAATKAMDDYTQGFASNEYGNSFNRALSSYATNFGVFNTEQNNLFSRLASLAGLGEQATSTTAGLNTSTANSIAQLLEGQGNAQAAGTVGSANAIGNTVNSIGSNLSNLIALSQIMGNSGYSKSAPKGTYPGGGTYDSNGNWIGGN